MEPVRTADEAFTQYRGMLFGIAYRLLGTVTDAEDTVQEAWLRWSTVTGQVTEPRAYLARTVTNLAINRLRSAAARRESYFGPWLPEPLVTSPDSAEDVELAESVSLAILVVLESLSPLERAVFVLHEAFGYGYQEIAEMLEHTPASVRQVGHRAREHVQARRPRYDAPASQRRQVTERFLAASVGGELDEMMRLLAPDVTLTSDGGGKRRAGRWPLHGAERVARFASGVLNQLPPEPATHEVLVNGRPGLLFTSAGVPDTIALVELVGERITEIYVIRNPDKLRHVPGTSASASGA